jgi:predicted RNA-binding protein with PIN domain
VLEDDDAFRARVAAAVDEDAVGRAAWIFLARPEGWQAELDVLRKEAASRSVAQKEERAEREAQRRLAGAEAAAARAEAAAIAASGDADRARAELEGQRAAAESLAAEVERARADAARAQEDRGAAIRRVKEVEATLAARTAELRRVRHELRMTQAELAQAAAGGAAAEQPGVEPEPAEAPLDRDALVVAVSDAFDALQALTAALGAASDLVVPPERASAPTTGRAGAGRPRSSRARRRPVALPGGVLDDSAEAADHLVRAPGALLLVDGYNISHAQWHGMPLAEQRARLVDACAELHARCGTDVEVVFDGAGDEATAAALIRAAVLQRFTPAGEEADDVILARIDEEPAQRPVLVASSDRRVRDGARARGANVLGARQLLAVLRR